MSFPMYRPPFMPGPISMENKHPSLLSQSLGLPNRPLLPNSHIMPDAIARFMTPSVAPPMMVLPSSGRAQNQATRTLLSFNPSSLNNSAPIVSNLGITSSSLSDSVQSYMNQANVGYQSANFTMPPPNVMGSGIPVCTGDLSSGVHHPPPPSVVRSSPQQAPVRMIPDSSDQELDPDQPLVDPQRTALDFFNSDLHLEISKSGYEAKNIIDPPGFCFCWAGVRATHGVSTGKVFYEVRIVENLKADFGSDHTETDPHLLRIGWSINQATLQLGEEMDSWGYGATGRFSTNNKFAPYGEPYALGDVIAAYLDLESKPPTISYAKNGRWLGMAAPLYGYKVGSEHNALFPHVLSKNCRFEVNFGQQAPWCQQHLTMGHMFIDFYHSRVRGSVPPNRKADCEMIMIVGLPGAGKTSWGLKMFRDNPSKCYNIIGTDTLIDKMKVMGLPRKNNYHGRWEVLIQKATSCLNKLFLIAGRRRRNYILDQTNVYASARKRKMKYFTGFRRVCAVVQPEDDELKRREWKRTFEDGKVVPEDAVLEMKFNYSVPDVQDEYVDEVVFIELSQQDANEIIRKYGEEARLKLPSRKRQVGPGMEGDQLNDNNKHMKVWDHQLIGVDNSSSAIRSLADVSNPISEMKFNLYDIQQQQQQQQQQQHGFNNMTGYQQIPAFSIQQELQSSQPHPPVGVPPPAMPGHSSVTQVQQQDDSWERRLRMPSNQGLLQTPVGPNPSNSFPDLSQPPPMFSMQGDFNQSPMSVMSQFNANNQQQDQQLQQQWSQQNFSPNTSGSLHPGDVDIRSENHPSLQDSDNRPRHSEERCDGGVHSLLKTPDHGDRYDYHNPQPMRDECYDNNRDNRFNDRRDEWKQDRNSRREPQDGYQARDRDEDRWGRRDGRSSRRSPDRGSYMQRGRGRQEDHRGARDDRGAGDDRCARDDRGVRDDRRWNDREDRSKSRDKGAFQERPSQRNRWEEGANDDRSSGSNRQQRSLLGDSPRPLIPVEMMDKWKDVTRQPRSDGGSNFEPPGQQNRPPPNPRFAGPRANQPAPPPLRGPRPMPPRVPPPSMGFRGPANNWP